MGSSIDVDYNGRSRIHGPLGRSALGQRARAFIFRSSCGFGIHGARKVELGPQVIPTSLLALVNA